MSLIVVIATLVGTVFTVLTFYDDGTSGTDQANTNVCGLSDTTVTAGGDVSIDCRPPLPQSLAQATFKLGSVLSAYYVGTVGDLPHPDKFAGYQGSGHCHWWGTWGTSVPGLFLINPAINVGIQSGTNELVIINEVTVEVFNTKPLDANATSTMIDCRVGGGENPGYYIDVDTVTSATTLRSDPEQTFGYKHRALMPPATITSSGLEGVTAIVRLMSKENMLYEGAVRVSTVINGEPKTLNIGSRQKPFRWISDPQNSLSKGPMVSWDADALTWVPR